MERSDWLNIEAENVQRSTSNAQRLIAEKSVQEILTILHKWGIHTLGKLAALDKEQLGARLGPEAVRMWERANGQFNRVLKLVRPPESFGEALNLKMKLKQLSRCSSSYAVFWSNSPSAWARFISLQKNWCCESRLRINKFTSGFSKFRNRLMILIFFFGCCTRIWRILNRSMQLLPSRWKRTQPSLSGNNSDCSKLHYAIHINSQKRSRV